MKLIAILSVVSVLAIRIAGATPFHDSRSITGNDLNADTGVVLLRNCKLALEIHDANEDAEFTETQRLSAMQCVSYINGFLDLHRGFESINAKSALFCLPKDINDMAVVRVVTVYLGKNLESLFFYRSILVAHGLRKQFPCSDSPS